MKEINKIYTRFNKQLKIYKNICEEKINLNVTNKKINNKLLQELNEHLNYRNRIVNLKSKVLEALKNKIVEKRHNQIHYCLEKLIKISGKNENKLVINRLKNNVNAQNKKNAILQAGNKMNNVINHKKSDIFRTFKNLFAINIGENKMENFNNIILDLKTGYNAIIDKNLILDNTRKDENILHKIGINNSLNDTAELDWYKGKEKISFQKINYLSDVFCDNILLYVVDIPIIENNEETNEETKQIMRLAQLGKKHSEETKKKMKETRGKKNVKATI